LAATESTMLELGTAAPDFNLPKPDGSRVRLSGFADAEGLIVAFICNHCPFVKHIREGLAEFARDYVPRSVALVAINSNDFATYSGDAPERMQEEIDSFGYCFPYVYDESQDVAKAYRAACTPEFYLFDSNRMLVYRGRFDAATPGSNDPVTGDELRRATDAMLAGNTLDMDQIPGIGCSIKWKPGNAPDYFGR
jgi:peroxiredoxin